MIDRPVKLQTLQQWLQSVIEHPGTDGEAWDSPQAERSLGREEAERAVRSTPSLSAVERIAIYRRMFMLRMTESMAMDYPGVKAFLGEEVFDRLITEEYIPRFPSNSYTLNHLGRRFPEFWSGSNHPQKEFLAELASLELALTEILDAEERPALTQERIAGIPHGRWSDARFLPIAAMDLRQYRFNVCSYLDAVYEGTILPGVVRSDAPVPVLVHRKEFRAYWKELSEPQFHLLSSLAAGVPFGEALAGLAERYPAEQERMTRALFDWFNGWVREGLFSDIVLS